MFSKYKLQQMGFDYIDSARSYAQVLDSVSCSGRSQFRSAYAYGIGMLLNFSEEYIYSHDTLDEDFKVPHYLHVVLASSADLDEQGITKRDLNKLQSCLMDQMEKKLAQKMMQEASISHRGSADLDEAAEPKTINHTTIFVPYYTEGQSSTLDTECALLLVQLGQNGRKKGVRSQGKMIKYLNEKIQEFMNNDGPMTESEYQRSEMTRETGLKSSESAGIEIQSQSSNQKVIVVTIACSDKMNQERYEDLSRQITQLFDRICSQTNKTIYCLNIHADGHKVQASKNDQKMTARVWEYWRGLYDNEQLYSNEEYFPGDVIRKDSMSNYSLTAEQKRIKKFHVRRGWIQFVKVAFRIVALIVCVIVFVEIHYGSYPATLSRLAAIGDFRPVMFVYATCTAGATKAFASPQVLYACNSAPINSKSQHINTVSSLWTNKTQSLTVSEKSSSPQYQALSAAHTACTNPTKPFPNGKPNNLNAGLNAPKQVQLINECVKAVHKYNKAAKAAQKSAPTTAPAQTSRALAARTPDQLHQAPSSTSGTASPSTNLPGDVSCKTNPNQKKCIGDADVSAASTHWPVIDCCLRAAVQSNTTTTKTTPDQNLFSHIANNSMNASTTVFKINNRNESFSTVDPTPAQHPDYKNVEGSMYITFIVYMALNCILIVLHCLDFQFKGKRGVLLKLQTVESCLPLLTAAFLTWFLILRYSFTSEVVFCAFQEDYFALRTIWQAEHTGYELRLQRSDYDCNSTLKPWFTAMIVIEVVITGLNFAVVVVSYYRNVLDIKPKSNNVKYE